MQIHNGSLAVRFSYDGKMTRKEERESLSRLADTYRQWNENYRQTGRPFDVIKKNEKKGLIDIIGNVPKGELRSFEAPPFSVELSPEAQQVLKNKALEELPESETRFTPVTEGTEYTPVTEIRSEHFLWTEEDGIVETVTEAEELAARKEIFRQEVTSAISQSIGEILKPRATYEEAFDALYTREGVAWKSSFDDSSYGFTHILTPVNGAFGALAVHLNDYLEKFGAEDDYYDTLMNALDELDTGDDNALLREIRAMVQTVKDGNTIDVQSDEFKRDVQEAIDETYGVAKKAARRQKDKEDGQTKHQEQAGLSFLDMERLKAQEDKQLLDKLTGEESKEKPDSAGKVFAQNRKGAEDTDFRDKLRKADENVEDKPNDSPRMAKATGTSLSKEDTERLATAYDAWDEISQRQGWGTTKNENEI